MGKVLLGPPLLLILPDAALVQDRGDPSRYHHVADNVNAVAIDHQVEPVRAVRDSLQIEIERSLTKLCKFQTSARGLTITYVDVNVSEANSAVGDEAGVEGVKVGDALHVGDEGSHAGQENDKDHANDARVEPLLVLELLAQVWLDLGDGRELT